MSDLYDNKDIDSTTMTFNSDYKSTLEIDTYGVVKLPS